jgi:hypothetical protein
MSGAVRQVKKLFSSDETKQAIATESQRQTEAAAPAPARMASPEERALALRRRRGTRSLLSEERMNAESGLGGDQTMLGG